MTFKETMAGIFSTAEGTYYKWKREKRPIISLLEKYFTKEDLVEFLETGKISKLEKPSENSYELDSVFEDYVITKLRTERGLNRSSIVNLIYANNEFITRHLKSIKDFDLTELTVANAKENFINFFSNVKLSPFLDTEKKRKNIIDSVPEFANIEIYLLLKYPEKFTS